MIVVIGAIHLEGTGTDAAPGGLAGRIAAAAAAAGSAVEIVARVGADRIGDELLLALARAGVGHVAVLRDSVHPTPHRAEALEVPDAVAETPAAGWLSPPGEPPTLDAADVELALRYLPDQRVLVAVHPSDGILREVLAGADFAAAAVVLVVRAGAGDVADLPASAVVVEAGDDPDGNDGLGTLLGGYAAALDRGEDPVEAFTEVTAAIGAG